MAIPVLSDQDYGNSRKITNLPVSTANGEPVVHQQLAAVQATYASTQVMTVSGNITAWRSIVYVDCSAGQDITPTLPAADAAAVAGIAQITIVKIDGTLKADGSPTRVLPVPAAGDNPIKTNASKDRVLRTQWEVLTFTAKAVGEIVLTSNIGKPADIIFNLTTGGLWPTKNCHIRYDTTTATISSLATGLAVTDLGSTVTVVHAAGTNALTLGNDVGTIINPLSLPLTSTTPGVSWDFKGIALNTWELLKVTTAPSVGGTDFTSAAIPAPSHTVPLTGLPRAAFYDTTDGIIKEARSDDPNKLCEMIVVAGTATTLTVKGAIAANAHGYPLGQALFVNQTGGLTTNPASIRYLQRVALAPHANFLVLYSDPPKEVDFSKLSAEIPNSPFKSKKLAILGDSITEFATTWPFLKEYLGLSTINNHGVSGSSIAWHPNNTSGTLPMQSSSRVNGISTSNEFILVWGGTNDYFWNIPLGTIADINTDASNSANTFYGGVNQLIDLLRARFPVSRIVFMTPAQRNYNYTEALTNAGGFSLKQYADAMVLACAARGVPVINLHEDFGMQRSQNLPFYLYDGVHFDLRGYTRLQYYLANALISGSRGGLAPCLPPSPPYFDRVFNSTHIPNREFIHVYSSGGIVYLGNTDRAALFFNSSITTLEWTQDANCSLWVGIGGVPTAYTGVSLKANAIGDFFPPTFANVTGITRLVTQVELDAMTRFRLVRDATGVTAYGFQAGSFVQTHAKFQRANFPALTGWATNFDYSTQNSGQTATNGNPDGIWWQMKAAKVNGIDIYQALQYGGI